MKTKNDVPVISYLTKSKAGEFLKSYFIKQYECIKLLVQPKKLPREKRR